VMLAVFWIGFTHLQSRFFVMAIPIAAVLVAQLALSRVGMTVAVLSTLFTGAPSLIGLYRAMHADLGHVDADRGFGFENLMALLPDSDGIPADGRLALIGEAKVFLYTIPMANLRYRTVFDVNAAPGESIIDAWIGPDAAELKRRYHLLINYSELRRLHAYAHIPEPPPSPGGDLVIVAPSS
jgi:hypothetical protein